MWEAFSKALASGLSLWESKESRKYMDKLIKLRRQRREELNKDHPDHATLDDLEFELQLLGEAFYSKVGEQNSTPAS